MIGIISAMQEEIQALLHELKDVSTTEKGMRTYYKGTLFNKKVVLVFSRWGKVASAITTTQLINDFNVDEIIFTGVAGGIKEELNIGDVVIGNNIFKTFNFTNKKFRIKITFRILKFLNLTKITKTFTKRKM